MKASTRKLKVDVPAERAAVTLLRHDIERTIRSCSLRRGEKSHLITQLGELVSRYERLSGGSP